MAERGGIVSKQRVPVVGRGCPSTVPQGGLSVRALQMRHLPGGWDRKPPGTAVNGISAFRPIR